MNERENYLRTVEFRYPEWIPCRMNFSPLTWKIYRNKLENILLAHPRLFPDFEPGSVDFDSMPPVYRKGEYYRDRWGCVWYNMQEGLEGQVIGHPLEDWSALKNYRMPDPRLSAERGDRDWEQIKHDILDQKSKDKLIWGDGERLFDRLYFLRGFTNLMYDFAYQPSELSQLIDMLEEYEVELIRLWLELEVDIIGFHTDFGTQVGLMISPNHFRKFIKPLFTHVFQVVRNAGAHVFLSSDGRVLDVVDDLIECGVSVHDPQLRANTLDGIARAYKGKLCADIDLDRQSFPFLKPAGIRQQIKEVVNVMRAPEGGLMLLASIYGNDVPLENIEAICEAMEDYCLSG